MKSHSGFGHVGSPRQPASGITVTRGHGSVDCQRRSVFASRQTCWSNCLVVGAFTSGRRDWLPRVGHVSDSASRSAMAGTSTTPSAASSAVAPGQLAIEPYGGARKIEKPSGGGVLHSGAG